MGELLGYKGNLTPLSITQDSSVRAPKQRNTTVATSIQDDSMVRKWKSVREGILNTARLVQTFGNIQQKEASEADRVKRKAETKKYNDKVEHNRQQSVLLEGFKTKFATAHLKFKSRLTTQEAMDAKEGTTTNYGSHAIDFNNDVLQKFGIKVSDDGDFSVIDSEAFKDMDEATRSKAIAYSMSTGYPTFVGLSKKATKTLIATKKKTLEQSIKPVVVDIVTGGGDVSNALLGFKKIASEKDFKALQLAPYDLRKLYFGTATQALDGIKDNEHLLEAFVKANQTTDDDVLNTLEYQQMMVKARTHLSRLQGRKTQKKAVNIEALVKSGELGSIYDILQKIPLDLKDYDIDTTSEEYKVIQPYIEKVAEAKNFDLKTPIGRRAAINVLRNKAGESKKFYNNLVIDQHLQAGGLISAYDWNYLSPDARKRIMPAIQNQVSDALHKLTVGDEANIQESLKVLNNYKHLRETRDTVVSFIAQQRDSIINKSVETTDGPMTAIEVSPKDVAGELAKRWERYPKQLRNYIPSEDKELYELALVVKDNPQTAKAFGALVLDPDNIKELETVIDRSAEAKKAMAQVNKVAGGYGGEAEEYFKKVYALTKNVKKAETLTKKVYGLQDVGEGISISPRILEGLTVEGDITDEVQKTLFSVLHNATNNAYKGNKVDIVDIPGERTKIVYHTKNGAEIPVILTDDKIKAMFRKVVEDSYKPEFTEEKSWIQKLFN